MKKNYMMPKTEVLKMDIPCIMEGVSRTDIEDKSTGEHTSGPPIGGDGDGSDASAKGWKAVGGWDTWEEE